MKAWL